MKKRLKNKKLLSLAIALLTAGGSMVMAQGLDVGEVDVQENRMVQVSVMTAPHSRTAIKVFSESDNVIRVIDEGAADEEGRISFSFRMPESALSGRYILDCCVDSSNAERFYFEYADYTELLNALNATDTNADAVVRLLDETSGNQYMASVMGFDMYSYNGFTETEKLKTAESFLELKTDTSVETVRNAFKKAIGIMAVQKGDIANGLENYNPTFNEKAYAELSTEEKAWISSAFAANMTPDVNIEAVYATASILYNINHAKNAQMGTLITEYASSIGFNLSAQYTAYAAMSDAKKSLVHDNMIIVLGNVNSCSSLVGVFESAVIKVNTSNNTGSGGSGGGGSSGGSSSRGSGGSGYPSKEAIYVPQAKPEETFSDLAGYDWAKEAIYFLVEQGIANGYEDGNFLPAKAVTREEFVKMAVCAAGKFNKDAKCTFNDVPEDKWYYPYIASAVEAGIISGIDENNFGTGMEVSRQDMAVIVYRTLALTGRELTEVREYTGFEDDENIADYAKSGVEALYSAGMINGIGEGNFCAEEHATRAQAAKVLADAFAAKEDE